MKLAYSYMYNDASIRVAKNYNLQHNNTLQTQQYFMPVLRPGLTMHFSQNGPEGYCQSMCAMK